jgi:putative nucleotidyltransferase with HDIG domain
MVFSYWVKCKFRKILKQTQWHFSCCIFHVSDELTPRPSFHMNSPPAPALPEVRGPGSEFLGVFINFIKNPRRMLLPREQALSLLHEYIKNERMIYHSLASEAVLRALARRLGRDQDKWGQAGLLHDLDVEITHADPQMHGLETARILSEMGVDQEVVEAIKLHNEYATGQPRTTEFHHALAAGETITGLILATSLVYPDKQIASVKPKSIVKRMKEKAFAASVKRENILECELLGLTIDEFAGLSIEAMTGIKI